MTLVAHHPIPLRHGREITLWRCPRCDEYSLVIPGNPYPVDDNGVAVGLSLVCDPIQGGLCEFETIAGYVRQGVYNFRKLPGRPRDLAADEQFHEPGEEPVFVLPPRGVLVTPYSGETLDYPNGKLSRDLDHLFVPVPGAGVKRYASYRLGRIFTRSDYDGEYI